jgi:hypothetical protein
MPTHNNVTWIYFQVCQAGSVNLIAGGSSSSIDVDYIIYGPLSSSTQCGLDSTLVADCGIMNNSGNIMFNVSSVGSYYKMMIANFANTPGGITIYHSASVTAAIFDTTCACTLPPAAQPICQVTTDPAINRNIVSWEKDPAYLYDYTIQKETTTMGIYSTLATVANGDSSVYEDVLSNPMIQSFKYRILTTDSCAQFTSGPPHTTIHLLTSLSPGAGYPQLIWNPYAGFSYGTYFIYRGATPTTLSLYDSISSSFTSYTDVNPASGLMYYSVGVFPPSPCQPSRTSSMIALSNTASVIAIGIAESEPMGFTLSPNPARDVITLNFAIMQKEALVEIIDISGRSVLQEKHFNSTSVILNINNISNGYYLLKMTNKDGVSQNRIIVNK